MKNIKSLLLFILVTALSCKKEDRAINWSKELNGSVWAGEFKYTSGTYTGLQPFSLILNDGSLRWYQSNGDYPATWSVKDNKITFTFPDNSSISAILSKDAWSGFLNITNNGLEIANLYRSAIPGPELDNKTFTGKYSTTDAILSFVPGQKLGFAFGSVGGFTTAYTIYGAGIRYDRPNPNFTIKGYGVFTNSSTIKGVEIVSSSTINQYIPWYGQK